MMKSTTVSVPDSLFHINTLIRAYEQKYHRPVHSVSLLAVSKTQSLEKMQAAITAGQYIFGENYIQEALAKIAALHHPQLEWHFTGTIQSNKTKPIAEHFAWVHTVCHQKIAQRLNDQRPAHLPPLNICLEVNVSGELTKSGVDGIDELLSLAEYCTTLPHLKLRGLMTIPAPKVTFADQRAELHKLTLLKQKLCDQGFALDTLSMGMTEDMEAAIAEGATIVRIGHGIFGE